MLVWSLTNCSATKPHLPAFPVGLAAGFAKRGIVLVKHLKAIVSPVTDIQLAVFGDLYAMHRVPKECRLFVAFGRVSDPRPGGFSGCVVNGIISVGAEMADILTRVGVDDQNAAVSVAVGDVQAVRCRVDNHVRCTDRAGVCHSATMGVVTVWSSGSSADPHFEIAFHIELQDKAVAALLVCGPRRRSAACGSPATGGGGIS